MRAALRFALVSLVAALATAGASAAGKAPSIVEAGGPPYPDRAYILTLPSARLLTRRDVHITENGGRVSNLAVTRQGTVKSRAAVVLAIDTSLTMRGRPLENAFAAARAFAAHANASEQIAIVTFNGTVNVLHGFTTSPAALDKSLSDIPQVASGTKSYDALERSLGLIADAKLSSGSVVILTDGQSVGNTAEAHRVVRALSKAHVRVFPVGLASPAFRKAPLERIASSTGGSFVEANGPRVLRPILVALNRRLSNEYVLSYRSRANPRTHVAVRVAVAGFAGAASSAYISSGIHVVSAKPYSPGGFDSVIQSKFTMAFVALLFALTLGGVVVHVSRTRSDPLVERVGDFVSVIRGTPRDPAAARQPLVRGPAILDRLRQRGGEDGWYPRLAATLDLADLEIGPYQLAALVTILTLLVTIVLYSLIGVFGLIGLALPFVVRGLVLGKIARKRLAFAEQLPDNLEVLASSLRAGHSLVGALSVVAQDAPEPSKSELQRVISEEQFGANLEDAFQIAVVRMANNDLDQVALVARLQREMGSNSAEVLDRVIETVRGRMELRRMVRTLTAQGRLSRWVLTGLPVALGLVMTLVSGSYMHPLLHRTAGEVMLVGAGILVFLGSAAIKRIVDIKVY